MVVTRKHSTFDMDTSRLHDDYRPVLMWFWNARPTEDELRRQIREFHRQGIRQFFVHAAYGLEIEYLCEEFFRFIGVALDEAKKYGMRFWIYDEYGWPSGTAGGSVLRDHPEDRMMLLAYGRYDVLPGDVVEVATPGEFVAAYVLYRNAEQSSIEDVERLEEDFSHWTNRRNKQAMLMMFRQMRSGGIHPSAKWSAFSAEQEGSLDGCSPQAVRHFLEATHEQYYARFPQEFGRTIAGSFIDEPVLCTGWVLQLPSPYVGLPWYSGLPASFQKHTGYDLRERLHELAAPIGNWRQTRCDYWKHLSETFSRSFTHQVGRWCADHGIQLTGHINTEESLALTLLCSGDLFPVLEAFHVPGADSICSKANLEQDESVLAPKLASSLAHQLGRKHVLCETYTGSGWDLSFRDMKRVFDRLAVLGVNRLQFMGAYYSVKGFRKLPPDASWPPSHSYQNVLWPYYHRFSEYVARVCQLNSQGEHLARVAVLYPITSAWVTYQFGHDRLYETDPRYRLGWETLQRTFAGLSMSFMEVQSDFDFVFEDTLPGGRIEDGGIWIGQEKYSTLFLPCCSTLRTGTLLKLEEFVAAGGELIFVNAVPTHLDDGSDVARRIQASWGLDADGVNRRASALAAEAQKTTELIQGKVPGILAMVTNCLDPGSRGSLRQELLTILKDQGARLEIAPYSPQLWLQCRKVEDSLQVCLVNTGSDPYQGEIHLPNRGQVSSLNPEQSSWKSILPGSRSEHSISVPIALKAHELIFLRSGRTETQQFDSSESVRFEGKEIVLDPRWRMQPLGGNLFRLSLSARPEDTREPMALEQARILESADFAACPDLRFLVGIEPITGKGTGWGHMQGEHPLTGFHPGKTYWLRAEFILQDVPSQISLVTEDLGLSLVVLNGQRLSGLQPWRLWDESNLRVPIEPYVRVGSNVLLMRCTIPSWNAPHALPLVALWGDFEVSGNAEIVSSRPVHSFGDWSAQGYPHFSGTMLYTQDISLPEDIQSGRVSLVLDDAAEVVEASVNGQAVGVRLWPPYHFDIGGTLLGGLNIIQLKVTNTSSNLFARSLPSGILGMVKIVHKPE